MAAAEIRFDRPTQPLRPGRAYAVQAQVTNTGTEVERFELAPAGRLAPWVSVDPPEVRLYLRESATVRMDIVLPTGPEPPAGDSTVGLVARTHDGLAALREQPVVVAEHRAVGDLVVEPRMQATSGWARSTVSNRVLLRNLGNVDLQVAVRAQDDDGDLVFDPAETYLACPRGTLTSMRLDIRCRRKLWWGATMRHRFEVTATEGDLSTGASGTVNQRAVLGLWRLLLIPLAFLLVLIALVLGVLGVLATDMRPLAGAVALVGVAVGLLVLMRRLR